VAKEGGLQEQVRRLGELVNQLNGMAESPEKARTTEIVQLLMQVHGQGLERILELVFQSGQSGNDLIDCLGKDEIAGGLLLLYSLHPDSLETRVESAVRRLHARLRKMSCAIELLGVENGIVRVRLAPGGHACGSSATELRALVEDVLFETAPDISAVDIVGLDEAPHSGFVKVETLIGRKAASPYSEQVEPVASGD
jgi:Fe-S cluster biogenesis protein NfuA